MKHHGRYWLPSPEELLLDAEAECSQGYMAQQLKRHKQKYVNDKRHREKRYKTRNGNKRT